MTVANTNPPKNRYLADGVEDEFDYTFEISADTEIDVYVDSTLQTLTTHYTVSGEGLENGGTVTFVTPPADDSIVTLVRNITFHRTADFQSSGPYTSTDINAELDRLWFAAQQMNENLSRTFQIGTFAVGDSDNLALNETADDRANKLIGFDADGDITLTESTIEDIEGQGLAAAASAAAAAASAASASSSETNSAASEAAAAQSAQDAEDAAASVMNPAPDAATYVTISTNATLTNERTLAGESGVVSITDGGAGNPVTVGLVATGIATGKIANDAITYAKMQNVSAASRLLGRGSAGGSGDVEELTLGAGLTLTGTSLASTAGANVQTFTASGTWTKPATGTVAIIELWAGGGSGGRNAAANGASGGGGGAYARIIRTLASLGATEAVTVGTGGAGVSSSGAGNAGGTTLFGGFFGVNGGGGGFNQSGGGGGGGGGVLSAGGVGSADPGGAGGGLVGGVGGTGSSDGGDSSMGGGGGGCGIGHGGWSFYGGGGGGGAGGATGGAGGISWQAGGGGGGSGTSTGGTGGFAVSGGSGGAGSNGTGNGVNGTAPGGGGGGSTGGTSGAGGDGMCRVTVV